MTGAPPLLLVHGDDRHRVDEEVRRWQASAAGSQLGVEIIDPPAPPDRLRSALAEVPLIYERRFVLVRDPPQLGGGRRSPSAERDLAAALELRAPSTSVCLVCHRQLPASHAVIGAVTRLGGEVRHRPPLRGRDLRAWVADAATARGVRLPPGGLEHLLRVAGSDLGVIAGELDKLCAYQASAPRASTAGPGGAPPGKPRPGGPALDLELLRRLVAGAEGVEAWDVLEQLLGPSPARGAASALALLEEGRAGVYLVATLAGQLSELRRAQAVLESGVPPHALASRLRVPEWRAERLARQARAVAPAAVEGWLRRLARLDVAIKTGEADDQRGVELFTLAAARAVGARRQQLRS